jgi:dehydrogenase/reductase SDR family protein 4
MMDINYVSTFLLIQLALPHLKKHKGSSVLMIGTLGAYEPRSDSGHYCISKLSMVAMTKVMGSVLLDEGVRVNCLNPGMIKTDFSKIFWKD